LQRLATDLILFGENDIDGVLGSYGLGVNDYQKLVLDADFTRCIETAAQSATTMTDQVRLAAKTAMFSHVRTLSDIASDNTSRPEDRVKAIKELREMGHIGTEMTAAAASQAAQNKLGALGGGGLTIVIGGRTDAPQTINITPTAEATDTQVIDNE
jgi:hypothetical protein